MELDQSLRSSSSFRALVHAHRGQRRPQHQRTLARHPTISIERIDPEDRALSVNLPHNDPTARAERDEVHQTILRALTKLTPVQREAIVLRYYSEYNAPDIARIVGCSADAARRRIHDGLVALERIIGQEDSWLKETLA